MNPADQDELQRLLSLLCDAELDEAESIRLNELLRSDAAARRFYLHYVDMHARLVQHPGMADFSERPLAVTSRPVAAPAPVAAAATIRHAQEVPPAHGATTRPDITSLPAREVAESRHGGRYILTAVLTLAASFAIQAMWVPSKPAPNVAPVVPASASAQYAATLIRTTGCVWADGRDRRQGARMMPGSLHLKSGTAAIHFDGGADLTFQGPAKFSIDGISSASVQSGRVHFRSDDSVETFQLRTPLSELADYGTEYAVVVGESSEELHVFDGEVVRTPQTVPAIDGEVSLSAGQARRFDSETDATGRPVPLEEDRFRIEVPPPAPAVDVDAGLLVHDPFDYDTFRLGRETPQNEGLGWLSSWEAVSPQTPSDFRRIFGLRRDNVRRDPSNAAVGTLRSNAMMRTPAAPIRLDSDGVYYASFLVRAERLPTTGPCHIQLSLVKQGVTVPQRKLVTTISWRSGAASMCWEGGGNRASLPIEVQRTYLVTLKIAASADRADQAFLRVYSPQSAVSFDEPTGWSVISRPVDSDLQFDTILLQTFTTTPVMIDELRIGTTWLSVARPYFTTAATVARTAIPSASQVASQKEEKDGDALVVASDRSPQVPSAASAQ